MRRKCLGAVPLGELVQRTFQVLAQLDTARIELQVLRPERISFLVIDRIVKRIVTIGAAHHPFGVDIPGAGQGLLVGQIQP